MKPSNRHLNEVDVDMLQKGAVIVAKYHRYVNFLAHIIGFGEYDGGRLFVQDDDADTSHPHIQRNNVARTKHKCGDVISECAVDIRHKFYKFDGRQIRKRGLDISLEMFWYVALQGSGLLRMNRLTGHLRESQALEQFPSQRPPTVHTTTASTTITTRTIKIEPIFEAKANDILLVPRFPMRNRYIRWTPKVIQLRRLGVSSCWICD